MYGRFAFWLNNPFNEMTDHHHNDTEVIGKSETFFGFNKITIDAAQSAVIYSLSRYIQNGEVMAWRGMLFA